MVSKFTLLSSILLASLALALPSSLVEASVARGHEERRSRHINHVASRGDAASDLLYAPEKHWAGLFAHGVRTIPMIHNHVPSHYFADSAILPASLVPSPSQTFSLRRVL